MTGHLMRDTSAALTTAAVDCPTCGTHKIGFYHDGNQCGGLVVYTDDEWRCVDCGAKIHIVGDCPECGASDARTGERVVVGLRPRVSARGVQRELKRQLVEQLGIEVDHRLTTVAQAHSHTVVEQRSYASSHDIKLADHLNTLELNLAEYSTTELLRYPDERTIDGVAQYLDRELDGIRQSGRKTDWTHFGLGVAFGLRGGVYVSLVLASCAAAPSSAELEQTIHEQVNHRRRSQGLEALPFDHHLAGIARAHSRDMVHRDFFAHESPDGTTPADRYRRMGHDPRPAGENISKRFPTAGSSIDEIATRVVEGWMNSQGHRENILKSNWRSEGIGVFRATDGAIFVTENFC